MKAIIWQTTVPVIIGFAFFMATTYLKKRRIIAFLGGAALLGFVGIMLRTYPGERILASIWQAVPILILIAELQIVSLVMVRLGIVRWIAEIFVRRGINPHVIQIFLIVLTYIVSCFMNNLAAIFVIVPFVLQISTGLNWKPKDIKTLLVLIIIASNLGGATTSIGDFPNLIILQNTNAQFLEFIKNLGIFMIAGIVIMIMLFFPYFLREIRGFSSDFLTQLRFARFVEYIRWKALALDKRGIIFFTFLLAMIIAFTKVRSIGGAMLVGGFSSFLFLTLSPSKEEIFKGIDVEILALFIALFIMSGAMQSTGLLQNIGLTLLNRSHNNLISIFALLGMTYPMTAFISAGPSTALFTPLVEVMDKTIPSNIAWWALSLGVMAGSSTTLIGATAGPVTMALYEKATNDKFSFWDFSKIGLRLGLIFLSASFVYMLIRLNWSLIKQTFLQLFGFS